MQRQRVYTAEQGVPQGWQLTSGDEVRHYVASVLRSRYWAQIGGPTNVRVRFDGIDAAAGLHLTKRQWVLRLPYEPHSPWAWREVVVAHELAHFSIMWTTLGDPNRYTPDELAWALDTVDISHGPAFCRRFIELTASLAGLAVADQLTAAFHRHAVDYDTPHLIDETVGPRARQHALEQDTVSAA